MPKATIPDNFLWGASTSSHQHEGGNRNQWTVWELENAKTKAAQARYLWERVRGWERFSDEASQPENYVSADAVDHYHKYPTDLALLKRLNMNTVRFSIEWSRIEPEEGKWDAAEIKHYREYLDECERLDITPVVTLLHFTLPVWFAQKGGFSRRRNIKYFERYCEKIITELGHKFRYCITVNEPNVYAAESYYHGVWPPNQTSWWAMWRVIRHLIRAHNRVAKRAKELNSNLQLSPAFHICYVYPGDDAWLSRLVAELLNYGMNTYIVRRCVRRCDFIGVNFYFSLRVFGYRVHSPHRRESDMGWDMQPFNLSHVLEDLGERYKKPIMVTENGLADAEDSQRQWWLTKTLTALDDAVKNGVDLIGYIHWSLLDNFEWDKGFWPRFGLISVNRKTQQRRVRESAKWYGAELARRQGKR